MAPSKRAQRDIAHDRVTRLLELAETAALEHRFEDADRYADLAWRVCTRYVLTPPPTLKTHVCRACHAYLLPGETSRTRTTGTKVSTTCLSCGQTHRHPFVHETKTKRAHRDR